MSAVGNQALIARSAMRAFMLTGDAAICSTGRRMPRVQRYPRDKPVLDPGQHRVEGVPRLREGRRGRRPAEAAHKKVQDVVGAVADADARRRQAVHPRHGLAKGRARGDRVEPERGCVAPKLPDDGFGNLRAQQMRALVGVQLHPSRLRRLDARGVGMEPRHMGKREPPGTRAAHREPERATRIAADRPCASSFSVAASAATV